MCYNLRQNYRPQTASFCNAFVISPCINQVTDVEGLPRMSILPLKGRMARLD